MIHYYSLDQELARQKQSGKPSVTLAEETTIAMIAFVVSVRNAAFEEAALMCESGIDMYGREDFAVADSIRALKA